MLDYELLITNNAFLKAYFTEFPKKLKQVADEGKFIKYQNNALIINYSEFCDYLMSKESVFSISSMMDFMETMQVLQFNRVFTSKTKSSYVFVNPNFTKNEPVGDDFYKQAIDITKSNVLKGTKRMANYHYVNLFNRLLRSHQRNELKISRLECARLRLQYVLQRKLDLMRYEQDIIEFECEEPDYVKNFEIAGYYGNVELSALKKGFGNYFPVFQEEPQITAHVESTPEVTSVEIISEVENIPTPMETNEELQQVPILMEGGKSPLNSENQENEPPKKRRRHNLTKSQKISVKETNDALMNLQKEFNVIQSST